MQITTKWRTIATVGFRGAAQGAHFTAKGENRAAHGGVRHLQVKKNPRGVILGREVNSNGNHEEIGNPWELTADEISAWESCAARER